MASEYWTICVEEGLGDMGISATPEQVAKLAELVQNAHEMEYEASGAHERNRPSSIVPPKKGLGKPYERGGSYYMDGSAPSVPYYVEDLDGGRTFSFRNETEARNFYDRNA